MTTKEYLRQTFKLDTEIYSLRETVETLESKATKTTTALNPNKVGNETINTNIQEDTVVKMLDLKNQIAQKENELIKLKETIFNQIYKLDNQDYRILLTHRYINFKTFEEIAVDMNYSYRHITRMHGWALQEFEKDVLLCPKEI